MIVLRNLEHFPFKQESKQGQMVWKFPGKIYRKNQELLIFQNENHLPVTKNSGNSETKTRQPWPINGCLPGFIKHTCVDQSLFYVYLL